VSEASHRRTLTRCRILALVTTVVLVALAAGPVQADPTVTPSHVQHDPRGPLAFYAHLGVIEVADQSYIVVACTGGAPTAQGTSPAATFPSPAASWPARPSTTCRTPA
jgi:hypothetical protein